VAPTSRRDVVVRFVGDTGNLAKSTDQVSGRLRGVATGLQGIAALGAVVGAVSFFKNAIDEAEEAERIGRKTEAVLKSTGGAANVTSGHISGLAEKLSNLAGVDDEVIQQGENVLLTFTQVRNEAGKGNDVFDQASKVALDMAAALDKTGDSGASMQENVIRIGKALNDPIKGMTALTKVGVTFTAQQKEQVAQLVESGDVMGAQKVILAELNKEFGGMAEANATASGKAAVAWGNFAESVGAKVMPAVNAISTWALQTGIPALGRVADTVGDVVVPIFRTAAEAGGALVGVWNSMPGPIQAGIVALGAWAIAGDKVTGFLSRTSGPLKNFGADVTTAMGAFDANRLAASSMVMQERIPVIGRMGAAFRGAKGDASGFGSTLRGVAAGGMSGLKSAAGGVMGLLGGPWGLALGGGVALLGAFAVKSQEAAKRQQDLAAAGEDLGRELARTNGVINENIRASAAKKVQDASLDEGGRVLGLTTRDLTDALLGEGTAREEVVRKATDYLHQKEASGDLLDDEAQRVAQLVEGLGTEIDAKDKGTQKEKDYQAAIKTTSGAKAAGVTATDDSAAAIDEEKEALDGLLNSLRTYWSESAAQADSQVAWEQQWDDLGASIKENGRSLDIHTEKGRNNRNNLTALIKTSQDMMAQDIAAKVPIDQAAQAHANRTNKLIAEAKRTGLNAREVSNLVAKYNGIPANVTTWLQQKGLGPVKQNLTWLTAIQTLLKDGIEATPAAINARMKKASGYTSSGKEDYAGGRASGGHIRGGGNENGDNAGVYRLAHNEFVQRAAATRYYGVDFMQALNDRRIPRGALPGLAGGGLVAPYPVNVGKTKIPTRAQVEDAYLRRNLASVGGGSGVQRWAPLVMQALRMLGQPTSLLPNVLRRMAQESGGNPNAINNWDSNAKRGTPSIGLMQTIGPTFAAYAGRFASRGIRDPFANIFAGLNYAIHRYPSLQYAMDKPGGYDSGGWLNPGQSGVNGLRKPEAVLTPEESAAHKALAKAAAAGQVGQKIEKHYHLTLQVTNKPVDLATQFARMEMLEGL
jgi:hypothetical protein